MPVAVRMLSGGQIYSQSEATKKFLGGAEF